MPRWLCLSLCLLVLAGCSGDDSTAPIETLPDDVFSSVLSEAGMVVPLAPEQDEVSTWQEEENGYRYTHETHDVIENMESVTCLGVNDDVIWPGNLVRGDQVYQYIYEPIVAPRAPITLSISLESSSIGGDLSQRVDNPTLSRVRQGISDLVDRVFVEGTHVPAQVDFTYQQVYSQSQMSLFVGADVTYGPGSLNTTFDWDETSTTTKMMAKYTQVYYSIDIDTPASPRDLFADDITDAQLRTALPAGSRPVYVAGVKYGMMAVMCIETAFSGQQMQMALDAAYNGAVDVELSFGYTAAEVLENSSIRVIVYGGSTGGINELTGFDGFMSIISASTEFTSESPGVPLVYKFRHVRDNTLALISLTSQYTIVRPVQIQQMVRVSSRQFVCTWSDDDDPLHDSNVDIDVLKIWCNAFDRTGSSDPGDQINPINETIFDAPISNYYEMASGSTFTAVGSVDLTFDAENHDFNFARLVVSAHAHDRDWFSPDDWATGYIELLGGQMWGEHSFTLYGRDFTMRVDFVVEPLN